MLPSVVKSLIVHYWDFEGTILHVEKLLVANLRPAEVPLSK